MKRKLSDDSVPAAVTPSDDKGASVSSTNHQKIRKVSHDDLPSAAAATATTIDQGGGGEHTTMDNTRQPPDFLPRVSITSLDGLSAARHPLATSVAPTLTMVDSRVEAATGRMLILNDYEEEGVNEGQERPSCSVGTELSSLDEMGVVEEQIAVANGRANTSLWNGSRSRIVSRILWLSTVAALVGVGLVQLLLPLSPAEPNTPLIENGSICVSGGGFSGFWFTLGRLESLTESQLQQSNFYCYSAGCLGVVARMQNRSLAEMRDMALGTQTLWKEGTITRYQVVQHFVDQLLPALDNNNNNADDDAVAATFPRLNVLTTLRDDWPWRVSVRTPTGRDSLRTLLVQSAWIPFATGGGLWHQDHMDGAFSLPQHPVCEKHVGLITDVDIMWNVINVNLGRRAVERLFQRGLAYGV